MSNDIGHYSDPDNTAVALFLLENESSDELTDILVAALDEAFRILGEEISTTTVH